MSVWSELKGSHAGFRDNANHTVFIAPNNYVSGERGATIDQTAENIVSFYMYNVQRESFIIKKHNIDEERWRWMAVNNGVTDGTL